MRLAYEQGLLSGRSLNWCQWWASVYHMSVKRWFKAEVRDDFLKRFTLITDQKRYVELYAPDLNRLAQDIDPDDLVPVLPEDFDSVEDYLNNLDQKRVATGAMGDDEGWL